MKKKLLFITLLSLISSMASATDFASEFDPYSTQQPNIETGYKKSKNNINSTYFYNENDSYNIATRAGYITTIILNPDEDIIHAEIGDATRWSIQTYYTGTSKGMSPIEIAKQKERNLKAQETKVNINELNYDYSWKKEKEIWSPLQVFDDGERTFILLDERVKATQLPTLFIKDEQTGEAAIVRHRYNPETRFYIVDRLFQQAILKYGEKEIIIKRKGSFIKSSNDHISVSI